jgi:hypothetical protein
MSQLRIQLSWKMNKREARVLKSPHLAELSTFFQITVRRPFNSYNFAKKIFRLTQIFIKSSVYLEYDIINLPFFQDDGIRDIDETELMEHDDCNTASQENIHPIRNM